MCRRPKMVIRNPDEAAACADTHLQRMWGEEASKGVEAFCVG